MMSTSRLVANVLSLAPTVWSAQDGGGLRILAPGSEWVLPGTGYQLTAAFTVDPAGRVYFTDARRNRILRIDEAGHISTWKEVSHGSHGIAYGPDRRLYAGQHDLKRVVTHSMAECPTCQTRAISRNVMRPCRSGAFV